MAAILGADLDVIMMLVKRPPRTGLQRSNIKLPRTSGYRGDTAAMIGRLDS